MWGHEIEESHNDASRAGMEISVTIEIFTMATPPPLTLNPLDPVALTVRGDAGEWRGCLSGRWRGPILLTDCGRRGNEGGDPIWLQFRD